MRPSGASLHRRKITEKRILKLIVLLRYPTKELYSFRPGDILTLVERYNLR